MEQAAPYIVNGQDTSPVTQARLVELLEAGRAMFIAKRAQHERKAPKARAEHDRLFHQRSMRECQQWIEDATLAIDALRRGLHVPSAPVANISE